MVVDRALDGAGAGVVVVLAGFEFPDIAAFVVQEAGVVVALVEVLEHATEDLGLFFREGDAFGGGFEELAAAAGGEEGREGEDVFVGGEEALVRADNEGDDRGGEGADFRGVSIE